MRIRLGIGLWPSGPNSHLCLSLHLCLRPFCVQFFHLLGMGDLPDVCLCQMCACMRAVVLKAQPQLYQTNTSTHVIRRLPSDEVKAAQAINLPYIMQQVYFPRCKFFPELSVVGFSRSFLNLKIHYPNNQKTHMSEISHKVYTNYQRQMVSIKLRKNF